METVPSYVQVAADGVGKKVRNVEVQILQPDGTTATAEMQVVAIADEDGNLLGSTEDWRAAMLEQAIKTNELLTMLLEAIGE